MQCRERRLSHISYGTGYEPGRPSVLCSSGVHLVENEFQAPKDNPPLILYKLIFVGREDYVGKIFQIHNIDTSNAAFELLRSTT